MKFTITALGGAGRSVGRIVDAVVRYLEPKRNASVAPGAERTPPRTGPASQAGGFEHAGPARYYADGGDAPGRWRGRGARRLGLDGPVEADDFARVLAGRDPTTGERLVSARGSAGRRPRLGVGSASRSGPDGEALYDVHDAAAVLGLSDPEVQRMVRAGAALAFGRIADVLRHAPGAGRSATGSGSGPGPERSRIDPGHPDGTADRSRFRSDSGPANPDGSGSGSIPAEPGGAYLVPVIDRDGHTWINETELARCEEARAAGTQGDDLAALGPADELLPLGEAARLAGVTARYLRRLAKAYEEHRPAIDRALTDGRTPREAYLVAVRGHRDRWFVRRDELAAFLGRRRPPAVRVGFDMTLTTEKSLGVLALLSDDPVRRAVLGAIEAGNDWGIDWLERHSAAARSKDEVIPVRGWTVASYQHLTSRALDPFPHHHNVVANAVEDLEGVRRALDARSLYRDAQAASALATAEMRWRLAALGIRWRPTGHGTWEVAGINDDVVREFSSRRNEIEEALRELEEVIGSGARPADLGKVILETRPAKRDVPVAELLADWRRRAAARGLRMEDLGRCTGNAHERALLDEEKVFTALAGPDGVCANVSVVDLGDVLTALVRLPLAEDAEGAPQPLVLPAEQLEGLARDFLESAHVVRLASGDARRRATYTTKEMLTVQDRIVARYRTGRRAGVAAVAPDTVRQALDRHAALTGEQQRLVRAFCTSGHRTQCAVGRPGAGKTTTMAAARDAWTAAGYRVVGAAVKGEAARTLAATTGIPTETLAWYLAHEDPHTAPLDARTVLVVDEASTVSDRDLDRLLWLARQTGATVRLIGDHAQHGAVEAGGMFRVLCERHPDDTPELTHTHRLRNPHDRAAADLLRGGDVAAALDELDAAGHLHVVDDELDAYTAVLTRWWHAHLDDEDHPMVDRRNSVRRALNRLAHHIRQAAGELGPDALTADGDRRFAVGDRVIARTPDRTLHPPGHPDAYVRNGATGSVVAVRRGERPEHDGITVAFDGIGSVDLPRGYFDTRPIGNQGRRDVGLDHAYAVTSWAVQGATNPVSTSRIDETSTRAETYVDITRGRDANHLYLTRHTTDLDEEHLPRVPPDPIDQAVADRLTASQGERTAWEIRQDALDRASRAEPEAVGL